MSGWVYEALHRALFVMHIALAGFVAGGTAWLVLHGARGFVARGADRDGTAAALRDWLPFALGLAITFGVGPILFVQLLDGRAFYTANLLQPGRMLGIVPALIAGFYLLYLQKPAWRPAATRPGRVAIPLVALACFGFTAWAWSSNHLLAMAREAWPEVWSRGPGALAHPELLARLLVFAGVAVQSTAAGLAWIGPDHIGRRIAVAVCIGAGLMLLGLGLHPPVEGVTRIAETVGPALAAQALLLGAGLVASRRVRSGGVTIAVLAVALLALIERLAGLREVIRAARRGGGDLGPTASTQGFVAFAATLVVMVVAIAWAVRRVRADLRAT